MKRKRGASAVFLTLILTAVLGVTAVLFEGACSSAARSMSEGLADLTGRSALSAYHRELKEEYGLFGLEAYEENIEDDLRYFIEESLRHDPGKAAGHGGGEAPLELVSLSLSELQTDASEYLLIRPDVLEGQILDYMKYRALFSGLDLAGEEEEMRSGLSGSAEAAELERRRNEEARRAREEQEQADRESREDEEESDEDRAARRKREQAGRRLSDLIGLQRKDRDGWTPTAASGPPQRELQNAQEIAALPSSLVDYRKTADLTSVLKGSMGEILAEGRNSVYLNGYISEHCADYVNGPARETFFRNEIEYILCGHLGDGKNLKQIRLYLYGLRESLNLAHIYQDPAKRRMTMDMALAVAPGPGAPFVQLLIAAVWAGAETVTDVNDLLAGRAVPFIKKPEDWKLSLDSLLTASDEGIDAAAGAAGKPDIGEKGEGAEDAGNQAGKGRGSYRDYLQLFLMIQSREARLVRLMDLIQLNMRLRCDREFRLENYCGGFYCRTVFVRRTGLLAPRLISGGYAIEKNQSY